MFSRILILLWPVNWLSFFRPVWGRHRGRIGKVRPYGWGDVWRHARHLWRSPDPGLWFMNLLYDGSEIF